MVSTITTEERDRLQRRIKVADQDTRRQLKHYRNRIVRPKAVEARGVDFAYVKYNGRSFFEPADTLELCHQFLDEQGVSSENNP